MVPVQQGVPVIAPQQSCIEGWYMGPHSSPSTPPNCTSCPYQAQGQREVFSSPGEGCEVGCESGYDLLPGKGGVPDPSSSPNATGYCHACTPSTHIQAWNHGGGFMGCVGREPGGPSGECPSGMEPVSTGVCTDCNDGEYVSPSGCRPCPRGSYCPAGVDLPVRMPPGSDRDDVATPGLSGFRCGRGHFRGRTGRLGVEGCCSNMAFIRSRDGLCDCTAGFDEDILIQDSTICLA